MAERQFNIVVNVDTKSADRKLNSFEKELKGTQKELQKLGGGVSTGNLNKFGKAANDATQEVKQLDAAADGLGSSLGQIGGSLGGVSGEVGSLAGTFLELGQTMAIVKSSSDSFKFAGRSLSETQKILSEQIKSSTVDMENFEDALDEMRFTGNGTAKEIKGLEDGLENIDAELEDLNDTFNKNAKILDSQTGKLSKLKDFFGRTTVKIVAVGAAAAIAASQMAKMTVQLSTMASIDTDQFQIFAGATSQFGINAEQASNILKDFNDRIGDFIVSGGGPLTDVMERLGKETGLTTDKLVSMSGPDGLIAIKTAMDDANLSMQEQVFILESLGSDLTLLLPLLKDNGAALKEFGSEFDTINSIVSNQSLSSLSSLGNEFNDTINLLKAGFLELAAIAAPVLEGLLGLFNKVLGVFVAGFKTLNGLLYTAAEGWARIGALASSVFSDEMSAELLKVAEKLKADSIVLFESATGMTKAIDETSDNLKALYKLQDDRAGKVNTEIQKQIANQTALAQAAGVSAAAYALELSYQTRLTAEETKRKELQKLGLRPEQIQALVEQYDILALAIKHTSDELARRQTIEGITKSQEDQLELLKARNDEERRWIELQQQIGDTALSPEEQKRIESLHAQILAQEELNRVTQETKDAYEDLGSAVTQAMLGSEDAIVSVIAQLIKLIALANGFDQNPFTQGLLSGLGGYADGGSFNAGETFMVGERGPEIITASAAGRVIPNHELGSSSSGFNQNISLSINGSIVASEELDRKFEEFAGAVADNTSNLLRNQMRTGGTLR